MNRFFILISAFFIQVSLWAQSGVVSGTIMDNETSETLIGANIVIEGTTIGSSTDFEGKYQFEAEAGVHTLVVSYIGYAEKKITEVEVQADEVTYLDIQLGEGAIELGVEVVVQASVIERTENALLMLQKKSDKIMDGLSSQEMGKYSLSNAASAISKISGATVSQGKYIYIRGLGDRYSSAQLNGLPLPSTNPYRNTPQLDLIPTSLLDNIVTSKSFSPDLPGNFTGGNVDIKTKTLPEQFFLSVGAKVSYNSQNNLIDDFLTHRGGKTDYWGFDDGGRALPDLFKDAETRSALTSNAAIKSRRDQDLAHKVDDAIRGMNRDFTPVERSTPLDHSLNLAFGDQYKVGSMPLGYIFSASFKKNYDQLPQYQVQNWDLFDIESGSLRNKGDYLETKSTETGTVNSMLGVNLKLNTYNSVGATVLYNHSGAKETRFLEGERPEQIIDEENLQGRGLSMIERELLNVQVSGDHAFPGLNNAKLGWKFGATRSSMNEPATRYFSNVYDSERDLFYIPLAAVQLPAYYYRDLDDEQMDGKIDFELPLGSGQSKIKIGGLYTSKDRVFGEELYQIFSSRFSQAYNGSVSDYLGDDNIGIVSFNEARNQYQIANYLVDFTAPSNSYTGSNTVTAGYAMWKTNVTSRLRMVIGGRYEKTDLEVISGDENKTLEERTGKIDDGDLLPVGNFIYSLGENTNLRLAYSRTLARPNMREVAPFVSYDPLTASFIIGNTELKKTLVDNFDLRYEWFVNPGEIIAVSGYYKDFTDPISSRYLPSSNTEIKFINVDRAQVYGIELELRKSLGFITPGLEKLKFNSNVSFIRSDVSVVKTSPYEPDTRPFEGQAPYIVNVGLLYDDREQNLDATLSLNWVGDRLRFLGQDGAPDIYDRARAQLDFNIQKRFGPVGLSFSAQNILNTEFVLSSEYQGREYLYSRYRSGTTLSLGVSYDIR